MGPCFTLFAQSLAFATRKFCASVWQGLTGLCKFGTFLVRKGYAGLCKFCAFVWKGLTGLCKFCAFLIGKGYAGLRKLGAFIWQGLTILCKFCGSIVWKGLTGLCKCCTFLIRKGYAGLRKLGAFIWQGLTMLCKFCGSIVRKEYARLRKRGASFWKGFCKCYTAITGVLSWMVTFVRQCNGNRLPNKDENDSTTCTAAANGQGKFKLFNSMWTQLKCPLDEDFDHSQTATAGGHNRSKPSYSICTQMKCPEQNQTVVQHILITSFTNCISAMETLEASEQNEDPTNNFAYSEATRFYYQQTRNRNRTTKDVRLVQLII